MKLVVEGHTVVINKMSIYIDGKMEFQAVNMITEYGQRLNGCTYAVASRYSKDRLEELYAENLKKFSPFIYLTEEEYKPIRIANNNDSKFRMRECNYHAGYEYEEELSEVMHDVEMLCADPEPDILTRIIQTIEDGEFKDKENLMKAALETLTAKQRKRLTGYVCSGKTYREIAAEEGTDESSVRESVEAAIKKIKKYFKKVV